LAFTNLVTIIIWVGRNIERTRWFMCGRNQVKKFQISMSSTGKINECVFLLNLIFVSKDRGLNHKTFYGRN
jgi:hypothetical protein